MRFHSCAPPENYTKSIFLQPESRQRAQELHLSFFFFQTIIPYQIILYFFKSSTRCLPISTESFAEFPSLIFPSFRYPTILINQATGTKNGYFSRYGKRFSRLMAGGKSVLNPPLPWAFPYPDAAAFKVIRLLCRRSNELEPYTPASRISSRRGLHQGLFRFFKMLSGISASQGIIPGYRFPMSKRFITKTSVWNFPACSISQSQWIPLHMSGQKVQCHTPGESRNRNAESA